MIGLNIAVDIYRPTTSRTTANEAVESLPGTATYSAVAARFTAAPKTEGKRLEVEAGGEVIVVTDIVLFEASTDVQARDYIKYGGDNYRVLAVEDIDKMGHHLEAWVVHVKGMT